MPKKILLADDSITIQKVVELTFSDGDYEVSAVNNGAKAIARLGEMRPDIILSDIIMPEKNGYEVCEYVKSHPDFRSIPVVLLTGTFEPFDPDRAEKAGCDAVVTKPFESQSLIHKVEELISQAQSAAAAAPAPVEESSASPWVEEQEQPAPSFEPPAAPEPFTHNADIFAAPAASEPSTDMPFAAPAEAPFEPEGSPADFGGETRAFPRMTFDQMQQMAGLAPAAPAEPEPLSMPEPSPWDEQPAPPAFNAEPPAFEAPAFESSSFEAPAPEPPAFETPSFENQSFGAQDTEAFGSESFASPSFETPAFEPPAFGEAPATPAESEAPFGSEAPVEEFGGETRAFPRMTLADIQRMEAEEAAAKQVHEPEPEQAPPPAAPEPSPWDEQPSESFGETRAFPRMSFEEMQQMSSQPAPPPLPEEPAPWEQPAAAEPEPSPWGEAQPSSAAAEEAASPFGEAEPMPFAPPEEEAPEPVATEPAWAPAAMEPPREEPAPMAAAPAAEAPASSAARHELTDSEVDRIARRVVELMSDQLVRNIAWEVVPDLAEMVVKERIRQLEAEA